MVERINPVMPQGNNYTSLLEITWPQSFTESGTKFDFLNSDLKDNITTSHRSLSSAVCMRLTILEIGMMAHPLYCARYLANHARSALTARVTLMLSVVAARRAARRRQMFWRPERSWIDGWLDQSASACISLECMSCARLPPYKT